jgi:tetratricopeptide (TPR) repeat protein
MLPFDYILPMPRLPYVFALAVALAGLTGSVAHADDKSKALALFEKSDKAYKAGKFEDAVKLLEQAYALYPEPILLYNLGRAQEGIGDVPGAIASYEKYLKDATQITDRGAIERRIETLKAQEAQKDSEAKRLADEEARRKQAERDRQLAEEARLRAQAEAKANERSPLATYGPWITIGTGTALLATGFVFGARASSTHDDAVASPVQRDAVELQHSAERSATIANVLFVVGGATLAGGIGWKIYQWRTDSTDGPQVTLAPSGVLVGGRW